MNYLFIKLLYAYIIISLYATMINRILVALTLLEFTSGYLRHPFCREVNNVHITDYFKLLSKYRRWNVPCQISDASIVTKYDKINHRAELIVDNYTVSSSYSNRISFDNDTITYLNFTRFDQGLYRCMNDTHDTCMYVFDTAYINSRTISIFTTTGSTVTFSCRFNHLSRRVSHGMWIYLDSNNVLHDMPASKLLPDTRIRIENIQLSDNGYYICETMSNHFYVFRVTVINPIPVHV